MGLALDSVVHVMTTYRVPQILQSIRTVVIDHIIYDASGSGGMEILCPICQGAHVLDEAHFVTSTEEFVNWIVDHSDFEQVIADLYPEIRHEMLLDFMEDEGGQLPSVIAGVREWLVEYLGSMRRGVYFRECGAVFPEGENVLHTDLQGVG